MPPSQFKPTELDFLKGHLPTWGKLKHRPTNNANFDQLLKEQTTFIHKMIKQFFEKFPERDPSINDPIPVTSSQEQLSDFPKKLQVDDPDAYAQLSQDAEVIHNSAQSNYTDLESEVLKK
ncbi:hypothetical protein FRC11_008285 [Ceratobasidium sp. 423]|nr:hypothetical protein FRC11_008285 [Ceratobasidium sp. 423]